MKFDFSVYKGSSIYLKCFESLIRETGSTRDSFLTKYDIVPSSFRRARDKEQSVGVDICNKLCLIFNKRLPTTIEIDKIEKIYENCYYDILFKNYNNYGSYEKSISELKKENLMIFPLISLLDVFIQCNKNLSFQKTKDFINTKIKEFKEYDYFFTGELKLILKIIDVILDEKVELSNYIEHIYNPLISYVLASKLCLKKKYVESLYASSICSKGLVEDTNYKRLAYLNLIKLKNYCCLKMYREAKKLSLSQKRSISSFSVEEFLIKKTNYYFIIASIGLEEYEDIDESCFIEPIDTSQIILKIVLSIKTKKEFGLDKMLRESNDEVQSYINEAKKKILTKSKKDFNDEISILF